MGDANEPARSGVILRNQWHIPPLTKLHRRDDGRRLKVKYFAIISSRQVNAVARTILPIPRQRPFENGNDAINEIPQLFVHLARICLLPKVVILPPIVEGVLLDVGMDVRCRRGLEQEDVVLHFGRMQPSAQSYGIPHGPHVVVQALLRIVHEQPRRRAYDGDIVPPDSQELVAGFWSDVSHFVRDSVLVAVERFRQSSPVKSIREGESIFRVLGAIVSIVEELRVVAGFWADEDTDLASLELSVAVREVTHAQAREPVSQILDGEWSVPALVRLEEPGSIICAIFGGRTDADGQPVGNWYLRAVGQPGLIEHVILMSRRGFLDGNGGRKAGEDIQMPSEIFHAILPEHRGDRSRR